MLAGLPGAGSCTSSPCPQLTEEAALDEASGFNIPAEPTLQPQAQSCRAEPEVRKTPDTDPRATTTASLPAWPTVRPAALPDPIGYLMSPIPPWSSKVQAVAARPEAEEEELPWCCICNEDATLRCASCDGDLYCVRCFRWVQVECSLGLGDLRGRL